MYESPKQRIARANRSIEIDAAAREIEKERKYQQELERTFSIFDRVKRSVNPVTTIEIFKAHETVTRLNNSKNRLAKKIGELASGELFRTGEYSEGKNDHRWGAFYSVGEVSSGWVLDGVIKRSVTGDTSPELTYGPMAIDMNGRTWYNRGPSDSFLIEAYGSNGEIVGVGGFGNALEAGREFKSGSYGIHVKVEPDFSKIQSALLNLLDEEQ